MQMKRWLYEPKSKRSRASAYRAAADECERAGFDDFALVNRAHANWIDPPPRVVIESRRIDRSEKLNRPTKPTKGADPARVGGRRDAAPKKAPRPPLPVPPVRAPQRSTPKERQ